MHLLLQACAVHIYWGPEDNVFESVCDLSCPVVGLPVQVTGHQWLGRTTHSCFHRFSLVSWIWPCSWPCPLSILLNSLMIPLNPHNQDPQGNFNSLEIQGNLGPTLPTPPSKAYGTGIARIILFSLLEWVLTMSRYHQENFSNPGI